MLVDVGSFRFAGRRVARGVDSVTLLRTIPLPFQPASRDSALQCVSTAIGSQCSVVEDGIYIRLATAQSSGRRVTANVVSTTTHQNRIPPAVCERRHQLVFTRSGRGWMLTDTIAKRVC